MANCLRMLGGLASALRSLSDRLRFLGPISLQSLGRALPSARWNETVWNVLKARLANY